MLLQPYPDILTHNLDHPGPLLVLVPGWAGLGTHLIATSPYKGPTISVSYTSDATITQLILYMNAFWGQMNQRINVVLFSYGAFAFIDVRKRLNVDINQLFLIGVRPFYPKSIIHFIQSKLNSNAFKYIKQFYRAAFTSTDFDQFNAEYLTECLAFFDRDKLIKTVLHLGTLRISVPLISSACDVHFIHGENDEIAPIREVMRLVNASNLPLIRLPKAGHLPIYSDQFWNIILADMSFT